MLKCSWSLRITTVQTMQNGQKNSAKLDFSKFCQTLANVQKRLPRSKFRAKLCARLPEKICKTQFFKILPNVSKCSETPSAFKISRKTMCKTPRKLCKTQFFSKFCQTLANVQKRLPRSKFRAKLCAKLPENFAKLD